MTTDRATIVYNGQPLDIPVGSTIADVLMERQVRTDLIAVEVNMEIVPKQRHAEQVLYAGDQIEVVTLVGGG